MRYPDRTIRAGLCALAVALAVIACEDAPMGSAVPEPASVDVAFTFGTTGELSASPRQAYLKTDRLWLRFRDAASTREESEIGFQPTSSETRIPLVIPLRGATESMRFELEIRRGADAVFRGATDVVLQAGRTTSVTVTLEPVIWAVVAAEPAAPLTALGDSLVMSAAAVFVTGDTLDGVPMHWSSLDPGVVSVDDAGTAVARADGTARLVVSAAGLEDAVVVRVVRVATRMTISPAGASIPVGGTRQYTATFVDRRGNVMPSQAVAWATTDPTVLTIDANGLARGVGVGAIRIVATADGTQAEVGASGVPSAPQTQSLAVDITGPGTARLNAAVVPNGGFTSAWFEWAPASGSVPPSLTVRSPVGDGLQPVPISASLQGLRPNTRYIVWVLASNSAGVDEDTTSFTTPSIRPFVTTLPVVGSTSPEATLNGTVIANGSQTAVWFEWGIDPSLQVSDSIGVADVNGFSTITRTAMVGTTLSTTYFYRIVARNQAGVSYGSILSFRSGGPPPPTVTTDDPVVARDMSTLNGTSNPNGSVTTVWFEVATDPSFSTWVETAKQNIGSGHAPVSFHDTFSQGSQTLWYRAVASNAGGTVRGATVVIIP